MALRKIRSMLLAALQFCLLALSATAAWAPARAAVCTGGSVNNCAGFTGCTFQKDCPDRNYCINAPGWCGGLFAFYTCTVQYVQYQCWSGTSSVSCTICGAPFDNGCCYNLDGPVGCPGHC